MYTTGYRFAVFVVYTTVDLMYREVPYDHCFMEEIAIPRATEYFQTIIMPEIISGYFYKNSFFHSSPSILHTTNIFLVTVKQMSRLLFQLCFAQMKIVS
jgi:hypothetical protein